MIEKNFLPDGFKAMLVGSLGRQIADVLIPALDSEPVISIRTNINKSPLLQFYEGMEEVPWCSSAFYLQERPKFTSNPLLHAGAFYVQDASSTVYETIVSSLMNDSPIRAVDLCAAPGGKTTAILNGLPKGSVMLANEFVASRANILKENLCKYGNPDVVITNSDTSRLAKMKGIFNLVAVDAPCSGEGMMRKEEVARAQWSEGLIRQCAALQRDIIDNAVEMLAPNGYLIYSTCTFNTIEDEDNAAYIAEVHGLTPINTGLAGIGGIQREVRGNVPCLRFMPGFTRGEGLFVAVFRKEAKSESTVDSNRRRAKKAKDFKALKIDSKIMATAKNMIDEDMEIRPHQGRLLAMSEATAGMLDKIPKDVRVLAAGVEVGEIKGKDLIPSHSLAMSTAYAQSFPQVELSEEDALRYLTRESIVMPSTTPKGFVTVSFRGFPLGFVKNLGNRCNNLYPPDYRIRTKPF